jgi:hypothetical protein
LFEIQKAKAADFLLLIGKEWIIVWQRFIVFNEDVMFLTITDSHNLLVYRGAIWNIIL